MTTTFRSALKATGLRKSFGDKVVLDGIDLDIAEGTTFSLLGPNGAGKPPRSRSCRRSSALTPVRFTSPASI
jgi:ABC-type transporter Mla maintaining outer membrane lipid asymmetry ATPase subunit MlaF